MGWDCVVEYSKEYELKSCLEKLGCNVKICDGRYIVSYDVELDIDHKNIRNLFAEHGESKSYEIVKIYS